ARNWRNDRAGVGAGRRNAGASRGAEREDHHLMAQRILIVEDEPAIAEAVEYALKAEGFEVEAVDDGNTALEQARARQYDLLVLDLMLPGLSGVEVCRRLRDESPV